MREEIDTLVYGGADQADDGAVLEKKPTKQEKDAEALRAFKMKLNPGVADHPVSGYQIRGEEEESEVERQIITSGLPGRGSS